MGLLANTMANPDAAFSVAGVDFSDTKRRIAWGSVALVAALHAVGLYAIATWTPASSWMTLWRPVEVKLIVEEAPKPPEVKPVEEPPPPPPKPQLVEKKSPPPTPQPRVADKPVVPEAPMPVMTSASQAPAPASNFVVPVQPEAPPAPTPMPKAEAAAPPAPKTISSIEFVRAPDPAYPMLSRRLGEQGKVMVRVLVDEKGHALDVSVQQSSGKPRLDEAAKKAVLEALFKPYREDGKAEQVYVVVPVVFRMQS